MFPTAVANQGPCSGAAPQLSQAVTKLELNRLTRSRVQSSPEPSRSDHSILKLKEQQQPPPAPPSKRERGCRPPCPHYEQPPRQPGCCAQRRTPAPPSCPRPVATRAPRSRPGQARRRRKRPRPGSLGTCPTTAPPLTWPPRTSSLPSLFPEASRTARWTPIDTLDLAAPSPQFPSTSKTAARRASCPQPCCRARRLRCRPEPSGNLPISFSNVHSSLPPRPPD